MRHIQLRFEVKCATRVQQNFKCIMKKLKNYLCSHHESAAAILIWARTAWVRGVGRRGKCKSSHDIRVCLVIEREISGGQPSG